MKRWLDDHIGLATWAGAVAAVLFPSIAIYLTTDFSVDLTMPPLENILVWFVALCSIGFLVLMLYIGTQSRLKDWRKKQAEAFKNEALNDIRPAVSEALKIARETQNQEKDYVPEWVRENLIELETRQIILVDLLNKDRQEEGKELLNLRPDDT